MRYYYKCSTCNKAIKDNSKYFEIGSPVHQINGKYAYNCACGEARRLYPDYCVASAAAEIEAIKGTLLVIETSVALVPGVNFGVDVASTLICETLSAIADNNINVGTATSIGKSTVFTVAGDKIPEFLRDAGKTTAKEIVGGLFTLYTVASAGKNTYELVTDIAATASVLNSAESKALSSNTSKYWYVSRFAKTFSNMSGEPWDALISYNDDLRNFAFRSLSN